MQLQNFLDMFPRAKRRGRNYWAPCPLHQDKYPSLATDATRQRAECFAGCTNGHWSSAIDFYAALVGMSNVEAIKALAS